MEWIINSNNWTGTTTTVTKEETQEHNNQNKTTETIETETNDEQTDRLERIVAGALPMRTISDYDISKDSMIRSCDFSHQRL